MNIQNTKKLTGTLLACALMLGGAIGASAAEPSQETDQAVVSAVMTKAVLVDDQAEASDRSEPVQLQLTRMDGAVPDGLTISVVPMAKIFNLSDTKDVSGQDSVKAVHLVAAEMSTDMVAVETDSREAPMEAIRLVPAKAILMEKIVVE